MPDLVPVRRALVSVSDKSGLTGFVGALAAKGVEIISTGGTASALRAAGIAVTGIDAVTGFPEILSGRVKTLHPKVHGALLGVRDDDEHASEMRRHGIAPIDLVCVNLYPFEETVRRPLTTQAEAVEQIDIGGPSMIRSGAKNFEWVTVVTAPAQYERVLRELESRGGATGRALRADLAADAFSLTARYDAAIAGYLSRRSALRFPPLLTGSYVKAEDLRYGENPHQGAALYRCMGERAGRGGGGAVAWAEQLHGKELSYNNILDASAAMELAWALARAAPSKAGACVVKHTNPCGAAVAASAALAAGAALAGDPLAAYGGILALNRELDEETAERLADKNVFLEVVAAPSFTGGALTILRGKSAGVRLLAVGEHNAHPHAEPPLEHRSIPGGLLVQERDLRITPRDEFEHRAGPPPSLPTIEAAMVLEAVARALLSNAVVIGGPDASGVVRLFGAGAGQMDRVTACRIGAEKAGALARGAIAFSDAFFPFPDGPTVLIDAGVKTLVHPGGSKRDGETFDLCDERGVTCLTTGARHFRH